MFFPSIAPQPYAADTEVVRAHHDLNAQMTARKDRLSFLIKFINDNSALAKVITTGNAHLETF